MKTAKRYIHLFAIYTVVFMSAQALHYIMWGRAFFVLINSLIMSVFVLVWAFSDGVYTPDNPLRLLRLKFGAVMVFWYFCKCCHDRFLMESDMLSRHSWYAYYVAILLLPVLCYEFSLYFGTDAGAKPRKHLYALYAPVVVLILLIMTNDYHGLAFSFDSGIEEWDSHYSRGLIYFISAGFAVVLSILSLINVFRQCTLPKSKKYIWMPAIPVVLMVIYTALYFFNLDLRLPNPLDGTTKIRIFAMVDVLCFCVVIFIETCGLVYRIATELPDEQSFILHKIWTEIEEQSDKAYDLINVTGCMEESYKQNLYCAGIMQTFNKRAANLILLGRQKGKLDFSELALSFAELVEFLKLNGTTAELVAEGKGKFTAEEMISVYRDFQEKIESVLPSLSVVMVVLSSVGRKINLRILAEDCEGNEL